ncbi:CLUMA_CG011277, isoform A [Clunio marinus]|uniref:CLUMA_CG011277, isoform A n=1 Tax=Clunio marinus TaxID=568069 RepID=A0A1J1IFU1_9DIPT|nr:CLUMA_CG011277, isoform A [Clunio marinus]
MTTPPSPSSCNGDVFFNFNDLRNPQTDDFYGSPRIPRRTRSHSLNMPTRVRLSSQGHDMTDDEDDSTEENFSEPANLFHEHYNYMVARENMQEFSGRVPQRKRKKESENPQQDSNKPKEPKFAWPLFALGVLAVGCGLLATR